VFGLAKKRRKLQIIDALRHSLFGNERLLAWVIEL
jgi:hypothetical protein